MGFFLRSFFHVAGEDKTEATEVEVNLVWMDLFAIDSIVK